MPLARCVLPAPRSPHKAKISPPLNSAASIPPKALVGRLNEIFSAFDDLCERHGLEKIKMIGDAYMAVGGLPTPLANHAQAAAELALAMQVEVARLAATP